MCPRPRASATPLTARLSDSVPPEVNTISSLPTRRKSAIRSRAVSRPSRASRPKPWMLRSEEHTSELQSQSNLVCRLLLEKKKKELVHLSHTAHANDSADKQRCY